MRTTLRQNNIKLSTHNTKQNENDITMYKIINDIKYIYIQNFYQKMLNYMNLHSEMHYKISYN